MKTVMLAIGRVSGVPFPILAAGIFQLPPWAEDLGGGAFFGAVAAFYVMYLALKEIGLFAAMRSKLFPHGNSGRRTDRWDEVIEALAKLSEPKDEDEIRAEVREELHVKSNYDDAVRHRAISRAMHKAILGENGLLVQIDETNKSRDRQTQAILARITTIEGTGTAVNLLGAKVDALAKDVGRLVANRAG